MCSPRSPQRMKSLAQELERQAWAMCDVPPDTYDQAFVKKADPLFEGDYSSSRSGLRGVPARARSTSSRRDGEGRLRDHRAAMYGWITPTRLQGCGRRSRLRSAKVIAHEREATAYTPMG